VEDQFMSPTYTKDVAEMLKEILTTKPAVGIYHMVNEGYCSWYEFTKEIFKILGGVVDLKPIRANELERLARRPNFSFLGNNKLKKLGLIMRDWNEALKDYLAERGNIE